MLFLEQHCHNWNRICFYNYLQFQRLFNMVDCVPFKKYIRTKKKPQRSSVHINKIIHWIGENNDVIISSLHAVLCHSFQLGSLSLHPFKMYQRNICKKVSLSVHLSSCVFLSSGWKLLCKYYFVLALRLAWLLSPFRFLQKYQYRLKEELSVPIYARAIVSFTIRGTWIPSNSFNLRREMRYSPTNSVLFSPLSENESILWSCTGIQNKSC